MTDILASIDDTLADWHGSADAMRWRPDGGEVADPERPSGPVTVTRITCTLDADPYVEPPSGSSRFTAPAAGWYQYGATWHFDPAGPAAVGAFDRYLRRQVLTAFGVTAAQVGLEGPSFLDARYHQRQRNRRRRR